MPAEAELALIFLHRLPASIPRVYCLSCSILDLLRYFEPFLLTNVPLLDAERLAHSVLAGRVLAADGASDLRLRVVTGTKIVHDHQNRCNSICGRSMRLNSPLKITGLRVCFK